MTSRWQIETMAKILTAVTALVAVLAAFTIRSWIEHQSKPPVLPAERWGPPQASNDTSVNKIEIRVSQSILDDLNRRLNNTRKSSPPLDGIHFQYGFNSDTLQDILKYWLKEYKWSEREVYLNKYAHYTTSIQGLKVHFVRVQVGGDKGQATPVLLLHGWPGSFREFYPMLDVLSADASSPRLDLIVPSLPGYGWSSPAVRPGLGVPQMAVVFTNLMKRLGHDHWYVQGGDWGSQIATAMAAMYPKHVAGLHLNLCFPRTRKTHVYYMLASTWPSLFMEQRFVERLYPMSQYLSQLALESGYFHIQATKPDTVGAGLADSPAGLAAYILEKFSTGTNRGYRETPGGGLQQKFTYDDLLDNVMIYWLTNTMTSAMRFYAENFIPENRALDLENVRIHVPTWCARFPHDFGYFPDWMNKHRYPMLKGSSDFKQGGHFASMEVPALLANDIILAIKTFEKENPIFSK